MEKKRYYSYKVYKDINPKSPTYGQFKYVRNPEKDDECTEKFAARWVLSRTACSLVPYGIIAPTDPYIETFKVDEYKDENPNSPTYNTYLYKQHGMCEAKVPEPKWTLVPEMSGASADPDKWDPNLIDGEPRYCIDTYVDKEPRSKTYNQYKYVKCDREYDETTYHVSLRLIENKILCTGARIVFKLYPKKKYNNKLVNDMQLLNDLFEGNIQYQIDVNTKYNKIKFKNKKLQLIDNSNEGFELHCYFEKNTTQEILHDILYVTIVLKQAFTQSIISNQDPISFDISQDACVEFNTTPNEVDSSVSGQTHPISVESTVAEDFRDWNITSTQPEWIECTKKSNNELTITTKPNE
jgi:hypothetical protein